MRPSTKKVRCVDNEGYERHLTVGKVYEVVDVGAGLYSFARDGDNVSGRKDGAAFTYRFVDVTDTMSWNPTSETKSPTVQVDDKKEAINFFKRRGISSNECPCGSTRGVCPDHR